MEPSARIDGTDAAMWASSIRCTQFLRVHLTMRTDATKESVQYMETIAEKRVGPGILMLTSSMQLLYRDRRSWELCAQINKHQSGKAANGVLPPAVADLCVKIMKALQVRPEAKDWEQFQLRRIVGDPKRPILLCGLGLPDTTGSQQ